MSMQSPTLRARRLGLELEALRKKHDRRSSEQVAQALGWSRQKLRLMEIGRMAKPQAKVISQLLDEYGVTGDERDRILALVAEARQSGWWHPHKDVLSTGLESYIAFEAEAVTLRSFESFVLPGLLQTAAYTRALIASRAPDRAPEEVEKLVTVRAERQRILTGAGGLRRFWVILDEAVLWRQFGQPQVMLEQLEHLRKVADAPESEVPQVLIQVLPFSAAHQPASGPFTIMTFENPLDDEVVYMETAGGEAWMEDEGDVNKIRTGWERLIGAARPIADTLPLVETVMATMK